MNYDASDVADDDTRTAGRGFLWVASAKVIFLGTAFATTAVFLPRIFTQEIFGLFSVVFAAASMLNNVLIASTIQTVSKRVSEDEDASETTLRHGLGLQAVLGGTIGLAVLLGAPFLAELYNDPSRTPLLQIMGAVACCYAIYAACVGYLNGRREFARQARLDATFSVLRTTGLIGGAALGVGAIGAIGGFAIAAATILLVALFVVGLGKGGAKFDWRPWIGFMAPIWIYQAALNGLLLIDIQVLNITVSNLATTAHADALAASYSAAQRFAFVPYQLILAVTFIVFPMVSRATSLGDERATKRYIHGAVRFSLLVLLAIASPIAGASGGVIGAVFPEAYAVASDALRVLVGAHVCFALFVIGATILTGAGRPKTAAAIAATALFTVLVATSMAIRTVGPDGNDALLATAIGTSCGTALALVLVGTVVYRSFGAFIPALSLLRGLAAAAAGFAVAYFIDPSGLLMTVGALALGFFTYGIVLVVSREIGPSDLAAVRKIVGR